MPNQDPRYIPLSRQYAPVLGPVVGAAAGLTGFMMMGWRDAIVMVGLFALFGLVAGIIVYVYDRRRNKS